MIQSNVNNQFYFLGIYHNQAFFRNTKSMKQISFTYDGQLPAIGKVVTIIFGSRPRVIYTQPITIADQERNIEIAMSEYGQTNAKYKLYRAIARRERRNSLKYQHSYFC